MEGSGIAFGRQAQVTASSTESGIAIGTESSVDGAQKGTAIGYKAKVLSSGDDSGLAIGTESSAGGNEGSIALGKKASVDSSTNAGGVAIGLNASAKGISSIVIGKDAKADDGNQAHVIAIGVGATATGTSQYSSVMGSAAKASREYSTVLGSNANSEVDGGVALGANSVSNRHAGGSATGDVRTTNPYIPAGAGAAQVNAINATKGTTGAVSVGSDTVKRQIINVAAGTDDSDAVNVAQLKAAAANAAGSVSWTVQENYSDVNEVKNGSKVNFADGANTTASVKKDASGKVTAVKYDLKKDVNLGADGSLTINGKTYVNKNGLNANGQKITNVATGTAGTDAVNVDQLNAAIGGTAKATTVKAKDANVTVTEGLSTETGGKEYTVGLGDKVTLGTADKKIVADGTSGKITAGSKVTIDGTTGDIQAGTVKVTGAGTVNELTNRTWDIDNPTVVHGQAATEDQLKTVSDGVKTNKTNITNINNTIGKGLNFGGDSGADINKKLGEKLEIKGGASADLTDDNIGVVSDGAKLNVKLKKDVNLGADGSLTINGKTYVNKNGLNANNQKITNVATGTAGTDAVNVDQLNAAIGGTAKATTVKAKDANVTVTKGTSAETGGREYTVGLGNVVTVGQTHPVTVNGDAGTVNGLTNTTWDIDNPTVVHGQAATEDQLKTVSDGVKTNKTNITKNANDITNINTTIGKGLNFGGDSGADINKKLGDKLEIKGGASADLTDGNIGVVSDGAKLNVKLKKDVDLGPNGSLTINGKTYVNKDGLNANGQKITNVADGTVNSDAVNFGQLKDAVAAGKTILKDGKNTTVEGEGTVANPYKVNVNDDLVLGRKGADGKDGSIGVNGKDGSAVVINGKDGSIGLNGKDGANGLTIKGGDGKPGVDGTNITRLIIEEKNGKQHDIATLDDGMKYGGDTGAVIKKKLNEQVNVVGGIRDESKLTTDDNIGVVSDGTNNLKVRLAKALKGLESITAGDTFINNNGITISNGAAGNTVSLTKNGLDNGGNKITNVAAGDVSANSTDAVNGSQLHDVKTLAGQHTTVKAKDSNITVTEGTNGTGGKEYTVGLGDKVTLGTDPSKQVSIDGTTGIIKAGDKVTIDGTTGNIDAGKVKINGKDGTVNGLTNKTWDPNNITSGQAATEDQLKAVDQKITNTSEELTKKGMDFAGNDGEFHRNLGEKVTIKGEGTKDASEYSGENIKTFADANGNLTVKMDKNLKTETIVATGKNGKDGKIGINGKDGVTTNISVTRDGKPGVDGAPGTTTTRIVYEKPDGTKEEVATLNDGMKYGGDTGAVIKKKLNEQVNVVGGITDTNKLTTEDNLGVVSDGNNNLKVRMAKDLKGLNSVTTNTLTVGDVKIDNSGINAGNKKITNVAAGDISANSTDAVNGGQLWKTNQTINNIGGAVNELGDRMDRVGAGAAALAALHPLDFDPDDKWDVAAGYGNYKDAHAVAVGAFYRPNEDTMFSVGGSFGGGENMVNAGVSVKLGQGNHVSTSKVAMAKEIVDLRDENKDLKKRLDTMEQKMNSILGILDMGKKKDFPDVPENHWAYEYVATLAGNGILEGYPDGMFSGDRTMTRYEFAAMFYRALKNGAPVDDNMDRAMNEFEPELRQIRLDRIRVDRISGKDNDRNKVERVRVNSEDDKANNDYRDVYGSHISPEA